jgi:hypothetical protein
LFHAGVQTAGIDRHVWDLLPQEWAKTGLVAWATEILFLSSLCSTKVSVVLFFRRLIDHSHAKWMNRAIWASIIFTVAYFLSFLLVLIFACKPVDAAWKSLNISWGDNYTCLDRSQLDPLNGVFSIFSDVYSMAIPTVIVTRLSVPLSRKIVLYAVFGCSLIVLGASIARTIWLSRLYTDPMRDLTCKFSFSYSKRGFKTNFGKGVGYDLLVWGSLEMQVAIICASAPAMKGFFTGLARSATDRYGSRSGGSKTYRSDQYLPDGGSSVLIPTSNAGKHASHNLTEFELSDRWDDEEGGWYPVETSHDMRTVPGKKARVQDGGILITETFSINERINPYYKERRVLGI